MSKPDPADYPDAAAYHRALEAYEKSLVPQPETPVPPVDEEE